MSTKVYLVGERRKKVKSVGGTDTHGESSEILAPVPDELRHHDLKGQFWIWAGANIAPINWILGALGVNMGLGLWETVGVLVLGNFIGMSIFGVLVVLGQKTGVTGMVLSRAVFGRRGAYLPAAIQAVLCAGWCAVNTWIVLDLVMSLLDKIGIVNAANDNVGPKIIVAAILMVTQVAISWAGYKAISAFERWTVPPTVVILAVMSFVAWVLLDVDWGYSGASADMTTTEHWSAITAVMTAIGIGWGLTWLTYAGDYSRFISSDVPAAKLFIVSASGQFIPVVWLGVLGATLATISQTTDPGQLIADAYGGLSVIILLLVLHGPIATNILNIYTCTMATKALDIRIDRRIISIIVGIVSLGIATFFILQGDFGDTIDSFLVGVVTWISPWAAIICVHWFFIAKRNIDCEELVTGPRQSPLPTVRWSAIVSLVAGMFTTWLFLYGSLSFFQGPIATAMGGIDLSWISGSLTAGISYAILGRLEPTRRKDLAA
ncbi:MULTISPECIES: purine-cytosine permease family protein [unclassified Corynebacterium]|uniref:purine-cytosine permease family protein n=1 Tax=unclassified Corynebacterium TaxID=2624378 RepID=UPI00403434C6